MVSKQVPGTLPAEDGERKRLTAVVGPKGRRGDTLRPNLEPKGQALPSPVHLLPHQS